MCVCVCVCVATSSSVCLSLWLQDFEIELAGAHIMKVQICSKYLIKEETYAHGKIRVSPAQLAATAHSLTCITVPPHS